MRIFFVIIVFLIGCRQKEINVSYLDVQKALVQNDSYKKFLGLDVIPRDNAYYMTMLCQPNVTLFIDYSGIKKVDQRDRKVLVDSLLKYYPANPEARADTIIAEIENLILFMKQYSIWGFHGPCKNSDNNNYFIDFYLSKDKSLRYYHYLDAEKKSYPDNVIEAKWIDSSWVYLKTKLDEE